MNSLMLTFFILCYTQILLSANRLPKTMRAVGYFKNLPISSENSLVDLEAEVPTLRQGDVLVQVKAIAVNPIDVKLRAYVPVIGGVAIIPGLDGSGIVVAKGNLAKKFNIGDEVFFVADVRRNGTSAQYIAIDEIFLGPKPLKLTFEEAAAMPLTSATAYEALYDRLLISKNDKGRTLLIINSAGGVGSAASQLAKNAGLTVIGTASRPETEISSRNNGVDLVINHRKDIKKQLEDNGYKNGVDYILVNYDPYQYWETITSVIKPQGKICLIVNSTGLVDIKLLLDKSVTLVSEMLMTKALYETEDKYRYQEILQEISAMLDKGILKTTVKKTLSPINATNLREAHRLIEENRVFGKLVLSGF